MRSATTSSGLVSLGCDVSCGAHAIAGFGSRNGVMCGALPTHLFKLADDHLGEVEHIGCTPTHVVRVATRPVPRPLEPEIGLVSGGRFARLALEWPPEDQDLEPRWLHGSKGRRMTMSRLVPEPPTLVSFGRDPER